MRDEFGEEVAAPSGYYQPVREELVDHEGRRVLVVVGVACIETSCCGVGCWEYLRVEGYLTQEGVDAVLGVPAPGGEISLDVDTVTDEDDKAAISRLLTKAHPGARVEFR